MGIVIDRILSNNRLQKLLYYTTPDCLDKPSLTNEQKVGLIGTNVRIVPKLPLDGTVKNYIVISCDNFVETSNPKFRDNTLEFDIICHFDQWQLKDFALRPYKIAGEIDSMLNGKDLSGIGKLTFLGASQMVLTDDFAGICLMYQATHGGEDQKRATTPQEDVDIIENFNEMNK